MQLLSVADAGHCSSSSLSTGVTDVLLTGSHRVPTGHAQSWDFVSTVFQAWKVVENNPSHGKFMECHCKLFL